MSEFERNSESLMLHEKVDSFFNLFDGKVLKNSDGKNITLKVTKMSDSVYSTVWFVNLDGYPEAEMVFMLDQNKKSLTIQNIVNFEHPDLKSKGIFPQIRRLIGQNFPEDLEYCIDVRNIRTRQQLLDVRKKYKRKFFKLQLSQAEHQILQNYWIQEYITAGFNHITVVFESENAVKIIAKKVGGRVLTFNVDFN